MYVNVNLSFFRPCDSCDYNRFILEPIPTDSRLIKNKIVNKDNYVTTVRGRNIWSNLRTVRFIIYEFTTVGSRKDQTKVLKTGCTGMRGKKDNFKLNDRFREYFVMERVLNKELVRKHRVEGKVYWNTLCTKSIELGKDDLTLTECPPFIQNKKNKKGITKCFVDGESSLSYF